MKNILQSWWMKITVLMAALFGAGYTGRVTATRNGAEADVTFPSAYVAKVGKLNTISVETVSDFKFFTDSKESYKTCGKDFIFAGSTPMTVWVIYLKDGKLQDPVACSVSLDQVIPDPKKPEPIKPLPDPVKPDPVKPDPVDPTAKAIQTAWQQEFMPNKQTYLPKITQLYQAMYDKIDTAVTFGDISKTMVDKSSELSLNGVCPVLSAAVNAELGKVFPRSPSVLIDKTVAKDALSKVLSAIRSLT